MDLSLLYFALSQVGLAIAWNHRRSAVWMLAAPLVAFAASPILTTWAPLMPQWGDPVTFVQNGSLFVGIGALGVQWLLGEGEPEYRLRPARRVPVRRARPVPVQRVVSVRASERCLAECA
jgi:hypothetical protein